MPSKKPSPIRLVSTPAGFHVVRLGTRYAVERRGEEHRGSWVPEGATPRGADDRFTESEARLLLPLLRDMEGRAAGKGGRPASPPTTPDGRLIARACKRLGITATELATRIGAQGSALSRARHGVLRTDHRMAIRDLLKAMAVDEPT